MDDKHKETTDDIILMLIVLEVLVFLGAGVSICLVTGAGMAGVHQLQMQAVILAFVGLVLQVIIIVLRERREREKSKR